MWLRATIARTHKSLGLFILFFALASFTPTANGQDAQSNESSSASGASSVEEAIQNILSRPDTGTPQTPARMLMRTRLQTFYGARDFTPAWSGNEEARANAASAKSALEHAYQQGLQNRDYLSGLARWRAEPQTFNEAAAFDIAMTESVFRYALDVRTGRVDPRTVYRAFGLPRQDFDVASALGAALGDQSLEDFFAELPPRNTGYEELVLALSRYRSISAKGGWPVISVAAKTTNRANSGSASALARRLALEDPILAQTAKPSNEDMRQAVLRFQRKNGLDANGQIDPQTLSMLNVPASYRALQIIANMERWRWMPSRLEDRYIVVDVPDQSLDFIDDGTSRLHSRVVIGRRDQPTPIMRTMVQAVVANPFWEIPGDIAAKEILPRLRKNRHYLASRNMILVGGPASDPHGVNIDWKHVSASKFAYEFDQSPGPNSVLGTIMLDSPNDFGVYMHGTSNRRMFLSNVREISHGCVRVEEIYALAMRALDEDPADAADSDLKQAIDSHVTQRVPLSEPLAAYMLYWTAFVDQDGTVEFRPDRYGWDPPLIARLLGSPRVSHTHMRASES